MPLTVRIAAIEVERPFYAAWARGGPRPAPLRAAFGGFHVNTWETVKSGAVTQMPLKERSALAAIYDTIADGEIVIQGQRLGSGALEGVYEHGGLDREDAKKVLDAVASERVVTSVHIFDSKLLIRQARDLGVVPSSGLSREMRTLIDWECGRGGPDPILSIKP